MNPRERLCISICFSGLTYGNLSHYFCLIWFKISHKNIMIRAVSVVCCVSQRFFNVLSLFSFHPQKVWDNYGSKKAPYQSRLTTSHQPELLAPFYLLKHSRREEELRNSHLRDPADFPPNFCLSLHVQGICQF